MTNPWENLATSIVIQAADDYRDALKTIKHYRSGRRLEEAITTKASCESFFKSDYAQLLTTIDPVSIMEHIKREVESECLENLQRV